MADGRITEAYYQRENGHSGVKYVKFHTSIPAPTHRHGWTTGKTRNVLTQHCRNILACFFFAWTQPQRRQDRMRRRVSSSSFQNTTQYSRSNPPTPMARLSCPGLCRHLTKPAGTVFSTLWSTRSRKVSRQPRSLSDPCASLPNCSWADFIAEKARFRHTFDACCSIRRFHWTCGERTRRSGAVRFVSALQHNITGTRRATHGTKSLDYYVLLCMYLRGQGSVVSCELKCLFFVFARGLQQEKKVEM